MLFKQGTHTFTISSGLLGLSLQLLKPTVFSGLCVTSCAFFFLFLEGRHKSIHRYLKMLQGGKYVPIFKSPTLDQDKSVFLKTLQSTKADPYLCT